jgi:hypothetical protein
MSQKIVMKKFGVLSIPVDCETSSKQVYQKNKPRIVKTTKPRHSNRLFSANQYNFKSNWLCKTCFKIFHLKPKKKFKTLLEYDLSCQNCQSKNITHSRELSTAINNNVPVSEIIKTFKEKDIELEFTLDSKSKYYAMVISKHK